jgi:FKBP-type peptidyl-prolyl cis-trans isomerase FklB
MLICKGWTEAMQLMVEGDKWEMYIPSDLGYGDRGSPPKIGGGDTLIFQVSKHSVVMSMLSSMFHIA